MAVEQVAFVIPKAIEAGLASGELVRYGGVVRNAAGHIVKHLDEVPTPKLDKALGVARAFAQKNPKLVIVGAAATVAIGGAAVAVSAVKRKKINAAKEKLELALGDYLKAIVDQSMNLEVVDALDIALAELRSLTGKQTSDLISSEVLDSLVSYSRDFILHNSPKELTAAETPQVMSLEEYLAKQRQIFDEAS